MTEDEAAVLAFLQRWLLNTTGVSVS